MAKQTKICEECKNEYLTFNSKQKFCCRSCYAVVDSKCKKEKYKTQSHHNVGRKATNEERALRSKINTETWKQPDIRKARIIGLKKAREDSEYPIGWSPESIEKRNKTIETNGGHNFKGKYGTRLCDITFKEKYGMTSHEYRNSILHSVNQTKPETEVFSILTKYNIEFESQYKFRNRYFDFAIPSKKILIEVDGVYWHGKNLTDIELNESQLRTRNNDIYKNMLVESSDWKLIRIWEDEIQDFKFETL
jgi:very-short-patch-repair endonuclease